MIVEEMSERDCLAMLDRNEIAYLACAKDHQPYVAPVRFDYDGGFLYAYTTEGQKIEFMRQNPLVCAVVSEVTTRREWSTVIVYGRYEELPNVFDYQDSRRIAERLFQRHAMWWEPATAPLPTHSRQPPVVFRIHLDRISGRRANPAAEERPRDSGVVARPGRLTGRLGVDLLRRVLGKHRRSLEH